MTTGPEQTPCAGLQESLPSNTPTLPSGVSSRALDFLRGAAAVYVLVGHSRGHLFAGGASLAASGNMQWYDYLVLALLQVTSMGTEAVILFFVLSGFAMAHSFSYSGSIWSFYKKRAIRIWPPYLAALVLAFVSAAIILRSSEPNHVTQLVAQSGWGIIDALQRAFYTNVNTELTGQFWSLPLEVAFYILCPLLLSSKTRVVLVFLGSILLTSVFVLLEGLYANPATGDTPIFKIFPMFLIFFMAGAVSYHFKGYIPRVSGGLLLTIFSLSFFVIWYIKFGIFGDWNIVSSIVTIPVAVLLIFNLPPSIYNNKAINWGHFSYSIYIVHVQLLVLISYFLIRVWEMEQSEMTSYWMWLLAVPPILAFSWVFYFVTERRCHMLLASVRRREREVLGSSAMTHRP